MDLLLSNVKTTSDPELSRTYQPYSQQVASISTCSYQTSSPSALFACATGFPDDFAAQDPDQQPAFAGYSQDVSAAICVSGSPRIQDGAGSSLFHFSAAGSFGTGPWNSAAVVWTWDQDQTGHGNGDNVYVWILVAGWLVS